MRKRTALLAVSALFLAGVLVGVLGTNAFYAYEIHQPGGLASFATRVLSTNLNRQLDLDAAQKKQVDAILADSRGELQQIRHEVVPRVFAIRDRAFDRIARVLRPDQQERLRKFRQRHARNAARFVGPW